MSRVWITEYGVLLRQEAKRRKGHQHGPTLTSPFLKRGGALGYLRLLFPSFERRNGCQGIFSCNRRSMTSTALILVALGCLCYGEGANEPAAGQEAIGGRIGQGVTDIHGTFIPGTSGADWPHPESEDLSR